MDRLSLFMALQEQRLRSFLVRYVSISAKPSRRVVVPPREPRRSWHGTMTGYTQHRCRCGLCVERNSERQRRRAMSGTCHECRNTAVEGMSRCASCQKRQREDRWRSKAPQRTVLIAALLCLLYAFDVQSQTRAYTLAIGRVDATHQEAQECYFKFSVAAMLVLHPKGEPCVIVRGLIGQTGRLVFIPD